MQSTLTQKLMNAMNKIIEKKRIEFIHENERIEIENKSKLQLEQVEIQKKELYWLDTNDESKLSIYFRLIVVYVTDLILVGWTIEALRIIEEYGLNISNDVLLQANLHKLLSIILWMDNDQENAFIHLKKARKLFEKIMSTLGITQCNFLKACFIVVELQRFSVTSATTKSENLIKV